MIMSIPHSEHPYQQTVETVNAALLSVRKAQNGDTAAMSHGKPPSDARRRFAARLAVIREAAGYPTQTAFAEALGMSIQAYSRYERAEAEPNLSTLAAIHTLTGVSLNFLVAGDLQETAYKAS
jgi:DNA-binding XRE family transcriptional regulator